jgi:hypothetical protein
MDPIVADELRQQHRLLKMLTVATGLLVAALAGVVTVNAEQAQGTAQEGAPSPATKPMPQEAKEPRLDLPQKVDAKDGSFSMKIPKDWTVRRAEYQGLMLWSPEGERKFRYSSGPIGDQPLLERTFKRPASPLLPPADVVKDYWRKVYGPLVQNMHVVAVPELPAEVKRPYEKSHQKVAIILYKYTLVPKQGIIMHDDELPPGLVRHKKLNMAGVAFISCPATARHNWSYVVHQGTEAPVEVFQKNRALYEAIDGSVKWDHEVVGKIVAREIAKIKKQTDAYNRTAEEYKKMAEDSARLRDEMSKSFTQAMMGSITCPRCRHKNVWTAGQCEECRRDLP